MWGILFVMGSDYWRYYYEYSLELPPRKVNNTIVK